jgi:glutaredoxin
MLPEVKTVPQIWIDDKHIGGYDELIEWLFIPYNV